MPLLFVNNNLVYPCNSILESDSVCMEGMNIQGIVILSCFGNWLIFPFKQAIAVSTMIFAH